MSIIVTQSYIMGDMESNAYWSQQSTCRVVAGGRVPCASKFRDSWFGLLSRASLSAFRLFVCNFWGWGMSKLLIHKIGNISETMRETCVFCNNETLTVSGKW